MVRQVLILALAAFSAIIGDAVVPKSEYRWLDEETRKIVAKYPRQITIEGIPDDNFIVMELPEKFVPPRDKRTMRVLLDFHKGLSERSILFCLGVLNGHTKVFIYPCDYNQHDITEVVQRSDISEFVDLSSFTGNHRIILSYDKFNEMFDYHYYDSEDLLKYRDMYFDMMFGDAPPRVFGNKIMTMIMEMVDHSNNTLPASSKSGAKPISTLTMGPGMTITMSLPVEYFIESKEDDISE